MPGTKPSIEDLETVKDEYQRILLSSMRYISDRYERDIAYHWIDTKLNLITGEDFQEADLLRGKNIIYSWIQGRGIESLSLHSEWIRNYRSDETDMFLAEKLGKIVAEVSKSLLNARKINAGHLYFTIDPGGMALERLADGSWRTKTSDRREPWNFSDIFVSRGLFCSSVLLRDKELRLESVTYINEILDGLKKGHFKTDQISLSEGNPAGDTKGRYSHAPWMIMIGSMTLLLREGFLNALDSGLFIIRYILGHFININSKWPELEEFDYVEFVTADGIPWTDDGMVLSDPGHALEFVGLSVQFLLVAEKTVGSDFRAKNEIEKLKSFMFPIFRRNFINGFNHKFGGICKLVNLKTRKILNGEMPWWSLPETMRAALGCYTIVSDPSEKDFCMDSYSLSHNAFLNNYLLDNSPGLLAIQTRDGDGNIIDSIPAVPDADPGYHTGLALMDCIAMIDKLM